MKLLKIQEAGRSMIEMLGVLAIVGILSVGGISGFSKAMKKHKYTKLASEYSMLIQDLIRYKDDFVRTKKSQGDGSETLFIAQYIAAAGLMPQGWSQSDVILYDSVKNNVRPFIRNHSNRLVLDYRLKTENDEKGQEDLCRLMILEVLKPYGNDVYTIWVYRGEENNGGGVIYGDNFCSKEHLCIKDASISDIQALCSTCLVENGCLLAIEFS
ncbi:MAG: type II secretion system GspH family protein [Acetobacter sp.]|nr:type II secretion system GspH family protein [Acetobacter sp.]